jgi:hypothetical protein
MKAKVTAFSVLTYYERKYSTTEMNSSKLCNCSNLAVSPLAKTTILISDSNIFIARSHFDKNSKLFFSIRSHNQFQLPKIRVFDEIIVGENYVFLTGG